MILRYEIVLKPKNTKSSVQNKSSQIEALFRQCAEIHRKVLILEALDIQSDHVRLLITLSPDVSTEQAINWFKQSSNKELSEKLSIDGTFWSEGYFVQTIDSSANPSQCPIEGCKLLE
jgi:REP element-mobilizing transposase RayT